MVTQRPILALVGGFLGAGKTTLILRAAGMLRHDGMRVAVITNDQDAGLVDTRLAEAHGLGAREVAGACFCCRFSGLIDAAEQLTAFRPDMIFAEPVGSCVDISATILQPLKAWHGGQWRLAPYTVLVDPARATDLHEPDVAFLFRHQIAEADILCLTKCDRPREDAQLSVPVDYRLSATTGAGVREWLQEVVECNRVAGARILDVDYTRYAEAEAALGWLNLQVELRLREALSPAALAGPLLESVDHSLTAAGIRIAHLKIFDRAATGYIKASLCDNRGEPMPEGDLTASAAKRHELAVNLRALGDPRVLRAIVDAALSEFDATTTVKHVGAFRPAAPRPEHRFARPSEAAG